jgi:hypothetical protein
MWLATKTKVGPWNGKLETAEHVALSTGVDIGPEDVRNGEERAEEKEIDGYSAWKKWDGAGRLALI